MNRRVVVVGAGVIGVACADALAQAGWSVTLIDRGRVGGACSHGNCGYVCPSHVLPLAGPGVLLSTLKTLFQKNSPLAIRFRADPALWSWMFRFARRCNRRDMLTAGRALHALLQSSRTLYGQLFDRGEVAAEWSPTGLLFVFRSPAEQEHYAATDALLRSEFGVGADRFQGDELSALEPALVPGLGGGWLYRGDGHLQPAELMANWSAAARARGVAIREKCEFHDVVVRRRRVIAVRAGDDEIPTDAVVVAAGSWTPLLHRAVGIRLPIEPGKGVSLTTSRPSVCPKYPMIFEEHRVAVTPFAGGFRIGSTMEFAGYDSTINPKRIGLLTDAAKLYLREPMGPDVREQWMGWRPMIPDGLPVIGPAPRADNLWIAAGHGMLGVSLATGTARLITEMLDGRPPHVDPRPYRADRF
ncbi:MAG: FAD-dependent oxidoreductase [Gemmataceae bacterium]|nr:FAD-dependent oxidoreductase [Gemmataceae bacterium]